MTGWITEKLKALIADIEGAPVTEAIVADVETAGTATLNYIKTNGLQDLYQIALTVVGAALPGASWTGILASIEAQAVTDGKTLLAGSSAVVASLAQSDLIAAGKLLAPSATPAPTPAPAS